MRVEGLEVGALDRMRGLGDLEREVEHGPLAGGDLGLAVIGGELVGQARVAGVDAQDGPMRDDAVETVVHPAGGDDDHLALSLAQPALAQHEGVVVGEEGSELIRPAGEGQKDIRDKPRLLLHLEDAGADVVGQAFERGRWVAGDGLGHAPQYRATCAGLEAAPTGFAGGGSFGRFFG